MAEIDYYDFIQSQFMAELKNKGITTEQLIAFTNSLIGINNFIKRHPKPILEYYWRHSLGFDTFYENIAKKFGFKLNELTINDIRVHLKKSFLAEINAIQTLLRGGKSAKVYFFKGAHIPTVELEIKDNQKKSYSLSEIKSNLKLASITETLSSWDIITNEALWNKCEMTNSYRDRHYSDDIDYYIEYKTGWGYLLDNKTIKLDMPLIAFFKNSTIVLYREKVSLSVCGKYGDLYNKETVNALEVFKEHPIIDKIIPQIINDPISWEGIFYDQSFCNSSILQYIKSLEPSLCERSFT